MKLKYFLRGIGLGMCLTVLILSFGKNRITDKEIIQRAQELGMTMPEETKDKLHNILGQLGASPSPSVSVSPAPSKEPNPTKSQDITPTVTIEPTPTIAPTPTKEPSTTTAPTKKPSKEDVVVSVVRGMSSDSVAKMLKNAGIIDDSKEFNNYIIDKGKASRIRVGTYSIKPGTSYDEIISIIAK